MIAVRELLNQRQTVLVELFKRGEFRPLCTKDGLVNEKQLEALKILTDDTTREFAYGGAAGGGKSFVGCTWVAMSALAYPGTRWFIGREELKRLRSSTLITLWKVFKEYGITGWKYDAKDNFILFTNGSRIDLLDLAYKPTDPMYERYGSIEYTGGFIEEAGEVNFGAYDTLKSRVGRHLNTLFGLLPKIFVTLNPKKNWVYQTFWKPFKAGTLPDHMRFLQAFVDDNKLGDPFYKTQLESIKDPIKRARLLEGNFEYDDDAAALIIYDKMVDCFSNTHVPSGRKCITADMARLGGDRIVMIEWDGFRGHITWWDRTLLNVSGKRIETARFRMGCGHSDVLIDQDGLGGGPVDYEGFQGFVNNARPVQSPENAQFHVDGTKLVENYDNLKAQCTYRAAERINSNGYYFTYETEDVKEMVIEEMEQVKQKEVDSDKKKGVLSKQEVKKLIGRSPDFWDAIMMREWFELGIQFVVTAS